MATLSRRKFSIRGAKRSYRREEGLFLVFAFRGEFFESPLPLTTLAVREENSGGNFPLRGGFAAKYALFGDYPFLSSLIFFSAREVLEFLFFSFFCAGYNGFFLATVFS